MTQDEIDKEDAEDADVPEMAVAALNAATRRMLESGHEVILVVNRKLVRIDSSGITILKELPPRQKVADLLKRTVL